MCRTPGIGCLFVHHALVVRDDLRTVEPLEVGLIAIAQLFDDVLLRAGSAALLRLERLQERTLDGYLVNRILSQEVVEADLAGVGDLLRCKWHG